MRETSDQNKERKSERMIRRVNESRISKERDGEKEMSRKGS